KRKPRDGLFGRRESPLAAVCCIHDSDVMIAVDMGKAAAVGGKGEHRAKLIFRDVSRKPAHGFARLHVPERHTLRLVRAGSEQAAIWGERQVSDVATDFETANLRASAAVP